MTEKNQLPEYLKETATGDFEITLAKSLDIDGAKVGVIVMREPTVQDLLAAEMQSKGQSDAVQEIMMFSNLCSVTPDQIKEATLKDYRRIQEAFKLFTT